MGAKIVLNQCLGEEENFKIIGPTLELRKTRLKVQFYPRFAFIYHLSKETPLRRTDTVLSGLGSTQGGTNAGADMVNATAPPITAMDEPDLTRQASDLKIKTNSYK